MAEYPTRPGVYQQPGVTVFVCGRGQKPPPRRRTPCRFCDYGEAKLGCDGPPHPASREQAWGRPNDTCSVPICFGCVVRIGAKNICPRCLPLVKPELPTLRIIEPED